MELNLQQLLERLQNCDECQRIEAKECKATLGTSAAETISAFSNEPDLGGGYLVLGLRKNEENAPGSRYNIMGVDDPDKIQGELASVCRSLFNIQVRPKISVESIDGRILIITNQDYRQINGMHTLAASNALRHLRDLGLLTMKGSGSETYYQPVPQIIGTPYTSGSLEDLTPYTNPLYKGLDAIPKGFPNLPEDLKNKIIHLKMRPSKEEMEDIITRLCSLGPLQPVQMGKILGRDAQYLRIKFLSEMIKTGKLVYLHPNKSAHPHQAYKVPESALTKIDL